MEVTALIAGVGALIGAIGGVLTAFFSLRRSLAREAERLERQESETRAAVDRLAHVVAAGPQGWFWTYEWQQGEREADKDLADAQYERFSSVEEMDAALARVPQAPPWARR